MKKHVLIFFLAGIFLVNSCGYKQINIKATSPNTEVVEAEGMAPIINNDILGAKETSLKEALKNALGLVVGVYVSKESLVSKAVLIEDNITSQTEGYIEKYTVIKEFKDSNFYKTKIKALVRKDDLSEKIKALDLEPKKLGNPIVKFEIEELIDGTSIDEGYSTNQLKKKFLDKGFVVSEGLESDILVIGKAESTFNTDQGLGGFISYRGNIEITVMKTDSKEIITTVNKTLAAVDVTKKAAAKKAISDLASVVANNLADNILTFLKERSTLQLTVSNIADISQLNSILNSMRSLIEVRDCLTRDYKDGIAVIDMDIKTGDSYQIAKRIEQLNLDKLGKFEIQEVNIYSIVATRKSLS